MMERTFGLLKKGWSPVPDEHIRRALGEQVNDYVEKDMEDADEDDLHRNLLTILETDTHITHIVKTFQTTVYDATFLGRIDNDPMLLGCNNGVVNIATGQLQPFTKDVIVTKTTGYDYFDGENVVYDETVNQQWLEMTTKWFPEEDERKLAQK